MCHTGNDDCLLARSGWNILIPLTSSQRNLYDIYLLLCIQYQTPDDGQKTCPKHVEFYSKNKFEKLVHLGFIIRIYHDARSSERHIFFCSLYPSNVFLLVIILLFFGQKPQFPISSLLVSVVLSLMSPA